MTATLFDGTRPARAGGAEALYADWCAANGTPPSPQCLEAFLARAQVGQRASDRLRARHGLRRVPVSRATERGGAWLSVREAIARCPRTGRDGVRGRRDAFVLTALEVGHTRHQVRALTGADLTVGWELAGVPLPRGQDPVSCPRCALARWCRSAWGLHTGSRAGAAADAGTTAGHDCEQAPAPDWALVPFLAVSLDQHGWVGLGPMSARTVTAIVTSRMRLDAPAPAAPSAPDVPRPGPVDVSATMADLEELWARFEAGLGALEARTSAAFDDLG